MDLPDELAESYEWLEEGRVAMLLRSGWADAVPVDAMLRGARVDAWGRAVEHGLTGRDAIAVVETSRGELVAKSITRGGLLGGLARRHFLRARRVVDEAVLGERLRAAGIATPVLVAARVTRRGAGLMTLDVATERLPGARDLVDACEHGASGDVLAEAAGRLLRRTDELGLRHRDLHVKNLLAPARLLAPEARSDAAELFVLDLDGCALRLGDPLSTEERTAALARFGRSAVKRGLLGIGTMSRVRAFARGYGTADRVQRAVLHDAITRVRRQVGLRRRLGRY